MEEEFLQIWCQISKADTNADVREELLAIIISPRNSLRTTPSICDTLTGSTLEFLSRQLCRETYPTLQIIRMLPAHTCVNVSWHAIQLLIETMPQQPFAAMVCLAMKLVTVLVHVEWPDDRIQQIRREAFPVLDDIVEDASINNETLKNVWLSWLSRSQSIVTLDYMQHIQLYRRRLKQPFRMANVFFQAVANQTHFLVDVFNPDFDADDDHSRLPMGSKLLHQAVQVVRMLSSMPTSAIDDLALDRLSIGQTLFAGGLAQMLALEVLRLATLQQRLYYHVPNLDYAALASQCSVIDYLARSLALNTFDYERARSILLSNHALNAAVNPQQQYADGKSSELDLYEQFTVVRRLYEAIVNRNHDQQHQNAMLTMCKHSLRNIVDLNAFAETVELCVVLLFLRWDHVTQVYDLDRTIESGSESSATPPIFSDEAAIPGRSNTASFTTATPHHRPTPPNLNRHRRRYERHGFVCSADSLAALLRMLRVTIAQRWDREPPEASARHRLADVSAVISDGAWRLSLFRTAESSSSTSPGGGVGVTIDVRRFLREHQHQRTAASRTNLTSSDEEEDSTAGDGTYDPKGLPDLVAIGGRHRKPKTTMPAMRSINNTMPRRKPRKQRPFEKLASGERSMSFSHSTENERQMSGGKEGRRRPPAAICSDDTDVGNVTHETMAVGWDGRCSIISKMLGSTEHLVAVCMNKGDFNATRRMIKVIEKSSLAGEMSFTESFDQTKEKLRHIFARLQQQSHMHGMAADEDTVGSARLSSPAITVDRIKRAVTIGLEVSTITNHIARFATGTPIHLTHAEETHRILHKFREKWPFLGLYQPDESLQATIVCDLLLSLANTVDTASNGFEVLQKLWPNTLDDVHSGDNIDRDGRSKRSMGYVSFLSNAVDAMQQHQQHNQPEQAAKSMQSLLSEDFLVISQAELAAWLDREKTFERICTLTPDKFETLEMLNGLQPQFKRLCAGSTHLHLLARANDFVQNTWQMLRFAAVDRVLSPTQILQIDFYETIGSMVMAQNTLGGDPCDWEPLLCKMNMNLVHVIAIGIGTVISRTPRGDSVSVEQLLQTLEASPLRAVEGNGMPSLGKRFTDDVWAYLSKHNPMLTEILQGANGMRSSSSDNELDSLANLSQLAQVSSLYGTVWSAAMNYDVISLADVCAMLSTTKDYGYILRLLRSLKCNHRREDTDGLHTLNDWLILHHLRDSFQPLIDNSAYEQIDHITDIKQRCECLRQHIQRIGDCRVAVRLIRAILLHDSVANLPEEHRNELRQWLRNVKVYARCTELLNNGSDQAQSSSVTWLQVKQLSETRPARIVEALLDNDEFALCLQWSGIHPIARSVHNRESLSDLMAILVRTVVRQLTVNKDLFAAIESLPPATVRQIYFDLITAVHSVRVLRYLIDSLLKHADGINSEKLALLHRVHVSLSIFELCASCEQIDQTAPLPWHLLTTPLLIIEQFLMNARFDALAHIVNGLRPLLVATATCSFCQAHQHTPHRFDGDVGDSTAHQSSGGPGSRCFNLSSRTFTDSVCDEFVLLHNDFALRSEHTLNTDCVDSLLRIYASKALDFRVTDAPMRRRRSSSQSLLDGDEPDSGGEMRSNRATDTTMVSADSLAIDGPFCMPNEPPMRSQWTRDEDATHCQCCRRAVFTLLTRRHHCRQCGRVVCHACSTKRELIVALYADVAVRVCDDCQPQMEAKLAQAAAKKSMGNGTPGMQPQTPTIASGLQRPAINADDVGWQFSGNLRHDELLRDEFCYEFAPSVSLCLSILALHSQTDAACPEFLLMHCGRFEALLRPLQPDYPNPEVDYALVTRMLHSLALAAKVRGGPPECDTVLEHADIIRAIVQHRCEALLPMDPLNRESFRRLRDSLVLAEKWPLALEVSLKRGFSTTGVMAAWGIACLKSGCFETAREKFSYCMARPADTSDDDLFKIVTTISYETQFNCTISADLPRIKRAAKSPPLLAEIVSILETTCHPTQPDVLARAAAIRDTNASLMSTSVSSTATGSFQRRRKTAAELPCHEPAMGILHTLSNLRHIVNGTYEFPESSSSVSTTAASVPSASGIDTMIASNSSGATSSSPSRHQPHNIIDMKRLTPSSRFYDECLYYLTTYANHNDIVAFLVKHRQTRTALKYIHYQSVEPEHFVHTLFLPHVRRGQAATIVQHMCEMDETLLIWRRYIIAACAHLERSNMLHSLYMVQLLFRDPVRASMTCVRFFERGATSYTDLQAQAFHLISAERHLTKELDLCQWEEIRAVAADEQQPGRRRRQQQPHREGETATKLAVITTTTEPHSVLMKWSSRTLNSHIGTIGRQLEVTKFLASCEQAGRPTTRLLPAICMQSSSRLPTLFGSAKDKVQLAILVLICGTNVTEGFGLAFRICQDFRLDTEAVYTATARYLAAHQRLDGVEQLLECIRGNVIGLCAAAAASAEQRLCDRILAVTVNTICGGMDGRGANRRTIGSGRAQHVMDAGIPDGRQLFDRLVQQVGDVSVRINCYIAGGQLKSAYLLAVQHDRMADIRKVMRHAETGNQPMIRRLCEKKLGLS